MVRAMVELLSAREIEHMRVIGQIAASTLDSVGRRLAPGVTTADIDAWVREDTSAHGAAPSQLGYHGFPAAVCTSVNDVACHGIPHDEVVLAEGDIVGVDVTSNKDGYHGDTCRTFAVGKPRPRAQRLLSVAHRCLMAGIERVGPGARLGDVGAAVEAVAKAAGFSVVTEVGGHGIGREMHMDPHVKHSGPARRGLRLRPGMAFTIEPIINEGRPELVEDDDGWTLRTVDGLWSAQFEHTILVTETGAEILTLPNSGS
ncbi:MAG: type I methionyl aminopeptidase [Myxococcota bacterium]